MEALRTISGADVVLTPGPLRYGGGRRRRDLTVEEGDEERFYSQDDYLEHELYYDFSYSVNVTKRESELGTIPDWGTQGVTEAEARAKCEDVLKNSGEPRDSEYTIQTIYDWAVNMT